MWTPARMPKLRDQTARLLQDPNSAPRMAPELDEESQLSVDAYGAALESAHLYWATPDMSALAIHSAATLPWMGWDARPADNGLIIWDGGVSHIALPNTVDAPIIAASWAIFASGPGVCLYFSRDLVRERYEAMHPGETYDPAGTPPLVPIWGETLPADTDWWDVDVEKGSRIALSTLVASWLLMSQETLAERQRVDIPKKASRAYTRAGRPPPEVSIVDLRRRYKPSQPTEEPAEPSRRYRHRFVVDGHWRDQPYGPGRELRRKQWIAAYVKGPDGAPLLETTRVNVWRR